MRGLSVLAGCLAALVACGGTGVNLPPDDFDAGTRIDAGGVTPVKPVVPRDAAVPESGAPDASTPDAGPTGPLFSGKATYYTLNGQFSCGSIRPGETLIAALNGVQYARSWCGKCARVQGPNGQVTVRIMDLCPGCGDGDLDLSEEAFAQIADLSAGRVSIKWQTVPCP
jgi:expansin